MKKNVRLGVFETNSSSEHSFAVINLDKFRKWKNGELVGRVIGTQEAKNCWGNFWSEMLSLEFTNDLQKAKLENESMFKSNIAKCLEKMNCTSKGAWSMFQNFNVNLPKKNWLHFPPKKNNNTMTMSIWTKCTSLTNPNTTRKRKY